MSLYNVSVLPRIAYIPIGRSAEYGVTEIVFDCADWLRIWPDLMLEVWATAPGGAAAYEAKTRIEGTAIIWEIGRPDTITAGSGKVEVRGYTPDKCKLSAVTHTLIDASLMNATADPPESQQPWYVSAREAADRAEQAAAQAKEVADNLSGGAITGSVRFDVEQSLTDEQKAQARANIGADAIRFATDATLSLSPEGVLSVNTADKVEADNTLPVTSAAVQTTVGNIEVLLDTI